MEPHTNLNSIFHVFIKHRFPAVAKSMCLRFGGSAWELNIDINMFIYMSTISSNTTSRGYTQTGRRTWEYGCQHNKFHMQHVAIKRHLHTFRMHVLTILRVLHLLERGLSVHAAALACPAPTCLDAH